MSGKSIAIRGFIALLFAFWTLQVIAVAVFAVGDRYSGLQAMFMTLVVLVGGFAPVAFLIYLFRDRLPMTASMPRHEASPGIAEHPVRAASDVIEPPLEALSERELEVLALIERGQTNKEIAGSLSVTVGTVKTHINNINRKLGSRTRTEALARARDHGLL